MHVKALMTAVAAAMLAVPAGAQVRERVQMPRAGAVSMIGVRLSDVTAESMKALKMTRLEGAVVEAVTPGSPAAAAGLHEKDVIVQFDGERVRSAGHLTRLVGETPVGREVAMAVVRDGRKTELRVAPEAGRGWFDPRFGGIVDDEQLREHAEEAARAVREAGRRMPEIMAEMGRMDGARARLGVNVQPLHGDLPAYFGVKAGVLVAGVQPDSVAARAGLKAGDVITAVNGKAVATPGELVAALPARDASAEVSLSITRDRKDMNVKASFQAAPRMGGRGV